MLKISRLPLVLEFANWSEKKVKREKNIVFVKSFYYQTEKMVCSGYNKIYFFLDENRY